MLKNDYAKNSPNGHTNGHDPAALPKTTPARAVVNSPAASTGVAKEAEQEKPVREQPDQPLRFVAPTHSGVDILKLLTELDEIVDNSHKIMGAMLRFDEDRFHMTVMKIRANLPEEMKRASKLVRDSERMIEETKETSENIITEARKGAQKEIDQGKSESQRMKELAMAEIVKEREALDREARHVSSESKLAADRTIAEARVQASQLVSDSEIVRNAEAAARDIRARAEAEAAATRKGANEYAAAILTNLQQTLGKAASEIDRGREVLERRK